MRSLLSAFLILSADAFLCIAFGRGTLYAVQNINNQTSVVQLADDLSSAR